MSKIYASYISNSYSLKNNLEKQVYNLLEKHNRIAILPEKLADFRKDLLTKIEVLNQENKRCKPIKAYWNSTKRDYNENRDDFGLGLSSGICNFYIYEMNIQELS
jgi:hypothetical protein